MQGVSTARLLGLDLHPLSSAIASPGPRITATPPLAIRPTHDARLKQRRRRLEQTYSGETLQERTKREMWERMRHAPRIIEPSTPEPEFAFEDLG